MTWTSQHGTKHCRRVIGQNKRCKAQQGFAHLVFDLYLSKLCQVPPPERKEKTTYYALANFQCNTEVLPEIDEGKEESYFYNLYFNITCYSGSRQGIQVTFTII